MGRLPGGLASGHQRSDRPAAVTPEGPSRGGTPWLARSGPARLARRAASLTGAVVVVPLVMAAAPLQARASGGPSGLWAFDVAPGTATVRDLDGDPQDLTLVGDWSSGAGFVSFTGAPGYATTSGTTFSPGDAEFAFGAVIRVAKVEEKTSPNVIQGGMGNDTGQFKIALKPADGGRAVCVVKGTRGSYTVKSPVTGLADGRWHTLVCSRQAGSVSISVDGVTKTAAVTPGTIRLAAGRPLLVASKGAKTTYTDQVIGDVDCAAVTTGAGALKEAASVMPC